MLFENAHHYEVKLAEGFYTNWSEESAFPHDDENVFQPHSTRGDDDGVFDGFDFNAWTTDNLVNGLDGVKAIGVKEGSGQKYSEWEPHLCGAGLKSKLNDDIIAAVEDQGALAAATRKKKKQDILDGIAVFLKDKGWRWFDQRHLFGSGKTAKNMKMHCGKMVDGDWYILMLNDASA